MIPVELIIMHFINQIFNENVFYQLSKIHNTQEEEQIEIEYIKSSKYSSKYSISSDIKIKTEFIFSLSQTILQQDQNKTSPDCRIFDSIGITSTTVISELSNDDDTDCSSFYLFHPSVMDSSFHPFLDLLLGIETTFLPVRIQKFIYSSKIKTKINQSTNIEVRGNYHDNICGIGQEEIYNLDLWIFPMDNKIEEPIFTFESIVIQQCSTCTIWSMINGKNSL
ncbi:unnamed protein product [Adineta steineri]|uniref:Uncharacterized protein n=1 Tax=Adineta steineri TaxID=433720 RepID=A0A814S016_9BILA|nr:unnamed protein product [Adineta steineri]CAF1147714.1 unnamed protein product [Adineta steineri]